MSGDSSHSVTTVRLPTNGQGLNQTQDSVGLTMAVSSVNTSCITNSSNPNIKSGQLSGIQDGDLQAGTSHCFITKGRVAELLVYPTPTQKKAKLKGLACVLISTLYWKRKLVKSKRKERKKGRKKREK